MKLSDQQISEALQRQRESEIFDRGWMYGTNNMLAIALTVAAVRGALWTTNVLYIPIAVACGMIVVWNLILYFQYKKKHNL